MKRIVVLKGCCRNCGSKLDDSPLGRTRKRISRLADGIRTARQIGLEMGMSTTRVVHHLDALRKQGVEVDIPRGAGSAPGYNAFTPAQREQQRREWHREIDEEQRLADEKWEREALDSMPSMKFTFTDPVGFTTEKYDLAVARDEAKDV